MTRRDVPPFRVERIDHVELLVPDRREAAAWYERVLGLHVCAQYEDWADDPRGPLMIGCRGGAAKVALFAGEPQGTRELAGFQRLAFRVSGTDFERFLDRLETLSLTDHRGRAAGRDEVRDHGAARSVYFDDPYGNRLEVTTYDAPANAGAHPGTPARAENSDSPVESGETPWLCHRCNRPVAARDGVVCSVCYRSTCRDCTGDPAPSGEPRCASCA